VRKAGTLQDAKSIGGGELHHHALAFTTGNLFCLREEGQNVRRLPAANSSELLHVNELNDMGQASPARVGGTPAVIRTETPSVYISP
jgi:hypothetical protein